MKKMLKKLPVMNIDIKSIMDNSEKKYLVMESELAQTGFIACDDEAVILTKRNGYLRFNFKDLDALIEELRYVRELAAIREDYVDV